MDRNGVRFRPHVKTHKVPEIARMQLDGGSRDHLRQAERGGAVRGRGRRRRLHRLPVFGVAKWRRIARLASRGVSLTDRLAPSALCTVVSHRGDRVEVETVWTVAARGLRT